MATNQTTSCDAAGFLVFSDLCTSYSAGGLLTAVVHVPEIAIKAIASVPLLTAQLNSVAWIISTALVLFITPILIFTLLCYAWSLKSVGPARKTLSTIFILLLWPVVPMLGVIAVTLLWSVLALVVMAFIVVLPLAGTVYVIWLFCAVLSSWKDDLERSHSDYVDITFFELGAGLFVAGVSACTTAPLVGCLALIKSPLVFLAVVAHVGYKGAKGIRECFKECFPWSIPFIPMVTLPYIAIIVVVIALATPASILVKAVASILWPGYVACGMLQTFGARRGESRRGLCTILAEASRAAYQCVWLSDIITNVWLVRRGPELAEQALEEMIKIAKGEITTLSADVRAVSCLPPVVIGVLGRGGQDGAPPTAWGIDLAVIARTVNMKLDVVEAAWSSFFQQTNDIGKRVMDEGLVTVDYISTCPPALIIGLPALVAYDAIRRSPKGKDLLILANGVTLTAKGYREGSFAMEAWRELMAAKRALERADISREEAKVLEAFMLSGGAPIDELPEVLATTITGSAHLAGPDGTSLPPKLSAIYNPIYALAYRLGRQATFKDHMSKLVYAPLCDYTPRLNSTHSNSVICSDLV